MSGIASHIGRKVATVPRCGEGSHGRLDSGVPLRLIAHMPEPAVAPSFRHPHQPAISCRGLVKRYGTVIAVDGVDLEVSAGECFGLLGPNGAGKTTTIEVLQGLLAADAGQVRVLGLDWAHDEDALRQRLGSQLQETKLADKLT